MHQTGSNIREDSLPTETGQPVPWGQNETGLRLATKSVVYQIQPPYPFD